MGLADHDSGATTAPSRNGVRWLLGGLAVAVAVAVSAVALVSRSSDHSVSATTPPSGSPDVRGYSGDLRELLLTRPATAQPVTAPITTDGVLSLDQAAQITHPEADAKVQLVTFGYQRGAAVQWRDGDAEVTIRLFQFASADKTQAYQDALDGTFAPEFFDEAVPSVQLVRGHVYVSKRPLDGRGLLATVTAVRGNLLMIITRYQATSAAAPITELAISQYTRLSS